MEKHYYSVSDFYKNKFGTKVYKLSLDAGCTCPTRDGTKGRGGCIFCSNAGSGDFASSRSKSIESQIEEAKKRVESKVRGRGKTSTGKYIAYFQNFTNTYGAHDLLEKKYREAIACSDIVGIAIATRPDCLDEDILNRISQLCRQTFVSIELGLQTIHEKTADYIRRGFSLSVYDDAVRRIHSINSAIHIVTHIIFGLPGETESDMLSTVRHCVEIKTNGIKMTVLYVLEGTDLFLDYKANKFSCMSLEEYFSVIARAIELLPETVVIHRLTGDGPKKILIAPDWTRNKRKVRNAMESFFCKNNIYQGSMFFLQKK